MTRPSEDAAKPQPRVLRIMTFNILHVAVRNFSPSWEIRRPAVAETIRTARPDVACLQEVSSRQLGDLALDLPEYEVLPGVASGGTPLPPWAAGFVPLVRFVLGDYFDKGELCPILLRKGSAVCVEHGIFWLCPYAGPRTPHVVNWARIEVPSGFAWIYNTHLGLLPWMAGRMAGELLTAMNRDWNGEPQILVGDFNSPPAGPLLRALTAGDDTNPATLHDAWLEARLRQGTGQTFHWGFGLPGPRIDYILVRPRLPVPTAMTAGAATGGVFPSDHFALIADLDLTHLGGGI